MQIGMNHYEEAEGAGRRKYHRHLEAPLGRGFKGTLREGSLFSIEKKEERGPGKEWLSEMGGISWGMRYAGCVLLRKKSGFVLK